MVKNNVPNDGSYVLTQILNIIIIHLLGSFLKRKRSFIHKAYRCCILSI